MFKTLDHGVQLLPRRRAWVHSALLWVMLFVWMLGACDRPKDQGTEGDLFLKSMKEQSKPKIALIMKSLANEFFSTMADGARTHESSHPDQYELISNGIKDERDLTRQAALVDEMIAAGVDAIVIAPADSKALVPALRRAKKAGIVVINIDNKLDDDVLASAGITIPFVGPNNFKGAKGAGEFLAKRLQHGDHVAILEGIRTSLNGTERRLGFEEAMKDAGVAPPGVMPIQQPIRQLRNEVAQYLGNCFHVSSTTLPRIFAAAPWNAKPSSMERRISPIPNKPITAIKKSKPRINSGLPNVKRN